MLTSGPPQTNSMIMSTLMKHSFKEVSSQKNLNLGEKFMLCIKNKKRETYQNWRSKYPCPGSSIFSSPCTCLRVIHHHHLSVSPQYLIVLWTLVWSLRRVGVRSNESPRLGTLLFRIGRGTSRWHPCSLFSPILRQSQEPRSFPGRDELLLWRATSPLCRSARNVPLLIK